MKNGTGQSSNVFRELNRDDFKNVDWRHTISHQRELPSRRPHKGVHQLKRGPQRVKPVNMFVSDIKYGYYLSASVFQID